MGFERYGNSAGCREALCCRKLDFADGRFHKCLEQPRRGNVEDSNIPIQKGALPRWETEQKDAGSPSLSSELSLTPSLFHPFPRDYGTLKPSRFLPPLSCLLQNIRARLTQIGLSSFSAFSPRSFRGSQPHVGSQVPPTPLCSFHSSTTCYLVDQAGGCPHTCSVVLCEPICPCCMKPVPPSFQNSPSQCLRNRSHHGLVSLMFRFCLPVSFLSLSLT